MHLRISAHFSTSTSTCCKQVFQLYMHFVASMHGKQAVHKPTYASTALLLLKTQPKSCISLVLLTSVVDAASVSAPIPKPIPGPVPAVEEAERPRKKARIAKEYVPGVGTANYAFIIILYQVQITLHPICFLTCVRIVA